MKIKHLKYDEIDSGLWDKTVTSTYSGVIFGASWYLDIVCHKWEALVAENYEMIMPLPLKTIMGKTFVYMPEYVKSLGPMGKYSASLPVMDAFLEASPYPIASQALSSWAKLPATLGSYEIETQTSFKLDLIRDYKIAKREYKGNLKGILTHAIASRLIIQAGISPLAFIEFMNHKALLKNKLNQDDLSRLRNLAVNAIRYKVGVIYGAYSHENELCAAAFFIASRTHLYLIYGAVSEVGESLNAMHLLLDYLLEHYSEKDLTLDLYGLNLSQLRSLAVDIGAEEQSYQTIRNKSLPWFVKLLKL